MDPQEFARGGEAADLEARRAKQARQSREHSWVVIDQEHSTGRGAHVPASAALGRVIQKLAPRIALFVAQSRPSCAWMIVRQTASPSPRPSRFEVTKGWKILSIMSLQLHAVASHAKQPRRYLVDHPDAPTDDLAV